MKLIWERGEILYYKLYYKLYLKWYSCKRKYKKKKDLWLIINKYYNILHKF